MSSNALIITPNGSYASGEGGVAEIVAYDPTTIYSLDTLPHGVASGDGDQDSIVLWTRSTALGQVTFEYATTPDFAQIVGTATASVTNPLQPVKVEVEGLTPGTDYVYRVIDAAGSVAEGRFTTAAGLGRFAGLNFGVSGDWRGEIAPYPSIGNASGENLDFFVALGDTIYADVGSPGLLNPDGSRKVQATTLDEFRAKHSEVYSARYGLNTLADLRGSTTTYAAIDDHEVTNDFAGGAPAASDPRFGRTQGLINDADLFENGLAAFQEYNPIRDVFYGNTGDLRTAGERDLYRFTTFGSDAATFLLDARSFRDPELVAPDTTNPADVARFLSESLSQERTMLGAAQLSQLKADLLTAQQSGITWKFVMVPEPIQELGIYNTDAYEGYAKERTDLLKFIEANDIRNVAFVAADIHGTMVNNLTYTEVVGGPRIATDTWEITTGSVGYSKPFGQTVVDIATAGGLLTQQQKAFYDTLPIAPDGDDLPNDKDDFLKAAFQNLAIGPAGYDPIGLNSNLSSSSGVVGSFDVRANLLQGDYVAAHTYGWTQFSIDATTQQLTVTTYGIDPYSEAELLNDPAGVLARTPRIVSQFSVDAATVAQPQPYTLQILSYYGESGLLGVETAPILGALIDRFDDQYAHTLVLGEGDSYIPGPWLVAGADPSLNGVPGIGSTAPGRPDIAIMNAFGTDASALGNHEFDLGSPVLQGALAASGSWSGARFPFLTANLDFAADSSLRGLADRSLGGTATNSFAGAELGTLAGKVAPYAISTQGGEKIGLIGITTFELLIKSSPNGTVPKDDGDPATGDLEEVALYVQNAVNALQALGVDKIVMVDQLDTIERNRQLAPLVSGVDVMVAGGGHERLGDADDVPAAFPGHDATFVDTFPIVTAGADGKPVLIVTTDTEYTYLGRLVVDFNAAGEIITANLDSAINGAYAATEATLQAAYGTTESAEQIIAASTIASQVNAITTAIDTVISQKDGRFYGYSDVYLEGDRVFGRAQEVNLGDISADANLFRAREALGNSVVLGSLKNGGGIRASIGSIGESGEKLPPAASPVKPAGAISQLDIENALRFDNKLMVFDTTPAGLLAILNHAAGLAPGNGGYAQVGGIHFSYDPSRPGGNRVRDVSVYDLEGRFVARVVDDGVVLPQAPSSLSVVSLNFTANGGDGYPIKANGDNFRYLLAGGGLSAPIDESLDFTAAATVPADALGEQAAFADFLETFHGTPATAYASADTPAALDERIQNLRVKPQDTVLPASLLTVNGVEIPAGSSLAFSFPGNDAAAVALLARVGGQTGAPAEVLATLPGAASGLPAGFPPGRPSGVLGADGGSGTVEFLLQDLATGLTKPLQVSSATPAGFTLQGPNGGLGIQVEVLPPAQAPASLTTTLTVGGESLPGVSFDGLTGAAPGGTLQLRLEAELFREAAFSNVVGFYLAERGTGNVLDPITGSVVAGGQFGADPAAYAAAALAGSLWRGSVADQNTATLSGTFTIGAGVDLADAVLLPYLQVDGGSPVYGPGTTSTPDGATHVQLLGSNTFGFEDLPFGGDNDFDDVIVVVRDLSAIPLSSGI